MAQDKKTVQEAATILRLQLEKEKPYILQLEKVVSETDSGLVEITLRVFKGRVTDLLVHKSTRRFAFPTKT